jgi:hypothetical protein
MMTGSLLIAGQLLAIAFACGLNLYATVAILALASRLGLVAALPHGMIGLENGLVIGIAAGLVVIEFVVDRIPVIGIAWEAVHTLIRPATAGMLAAIALSTATVDVQIAGASAAALMTLAAHASKVGNRLIVSTRAAYLRRSPGRRRLIFTALDFIEDIIAVAIVAAALLYPTAATGILAGALLLLLIAGPRLWRAAILGTRAVRARLRGFFEGADWLSRDQLPPFIRASIPVEPLGRSPARAVAAAVSGVARIGAYRNGWLVFTCDGPRFIYRALFHTRSTTLPPPATVELRAGTLADMIDVRSNGSGRFTLYLLKDGPPLQVAAAELTS